MERLSLATNLSSLSIDSTAECPSEELDLLLLALSERLQRLSLVVTKPHTANGIFACVAGMTALQSLTIDDRAQGLYFIHLQNCRQLEYLDLKGESTCLVAPFSRDCHPLKFSNAVFRNL